MAKYTETLAEYMNNGGELPAVFDTINGFSDLFVAKYIDREIGSETEDLFKIKLELKANLVIPAYKARIDEKAELKELLLHPSKKRVRSGNTTRTREGTISHTTGLADNETITTRNGSIVHTIDGTDTGSPNNQTVTTKELPFTSVQPDTINPSTITDTQNGQTVQTVHNTDEEKYNNYTENVHTTNKSRTDSEGYDGYKETETYNNITEAEEGLSPSEVLAIMQNFESEVNIILQQLLNEFNNNFMVIY